MVSFEPLSALFEQIKDGENEKTCHPSFVGRKELRGGGKEWNEKKRDEENVNEEEGNWKQRKDMIGWKKMKWGKKER